VIIVKDILKREVVYSVVVPVFNSERSLGRLNSELHEVMGKLGESYELVYVDDCSPDESWEVLKSLQNQSANVRIIRLAGNVGQLTALICGVQHSIGQHVITIDDDLEYNTFDILNLVNFYRAHSYLIVYGMPKGKSKKNLSYRLFFRARNLMLNYLLGKQPSEGFRVFNRIIMSDSNGNITTSIHLDAYDKLTLHRKFVSYFEVDYRARPFGKSGHNVLKKIGIISKFGLEYLTSPLKIYVYLGLAQLVITVGSIMASTISPDRFDLRLPVLWTLVFQSLVLIAIGILAYYSASIHLRLKGKPDYIILQKL